MNVTTFCLRVSEEYTGLLGLSCDFQQKLYSTVIRWYVNASNSLLIFLIRRHSLHIDK